MAHVNCGDCHVSCLNSGFLLFGCKESMLTGGVYHIDESKSAFRCWWLQFGNKGVRTGVGTGTAVGEGVELGGDVSGKLEVVLWGEDIGETGSGGSRQRFEGLVVSFKEPVVIERREQFQFDPKEA